jgi:hypothetical protein
MSSMLPRMSGKPLVSYWNLSQIRAVWERLIFHFFFNQEGFYIFFAHF